VDVGISQFKTKSKTFTLLDAPGHKDFIPNMISGTSQADVAILVVNASEGEFETGFAKGGQTKEHALLVKSLGIIQLIVCINKMDSISWSKERYEDIKFQMSEFLMLNGFEMKFVQFLPASGYTGENLTENRKVEWYDGPTLVGLLGIFTANIDQLEFPLRDLQGSFSLSVQDFYKGGIGPGTSGAVTVCGRISCGKIQIGENVLALPINQYGTVKAIQVGEDVSKWAVAGDRVSISLLGLESIQINMGTVICDPNNPITVTDHFRAQIKTFEIKIPITIGVPVVIHHLGSVESGYIKTLESVALATGTRKNPRSLSSNQEATVTIQLEKSVCLQTIEQSKELSRFLVRRGSESVASGIVVELFPKTK
jgi:elongation factor 1 alpha-like protein